MSARAVISDQGVRTSTKRPNKQRTAFGSAAPQMCTNENRFKMGKKDGIHEVSAIPAALLAPPSS